MSGAGSRRVAGSVPIMTSDEDGGAEVDAHVHDIPIGDSWHFVDKFISEIEGRIQGWLFKADTLCLWYIDSLQKANDVRGDLCEIGVYHGKSLLLMANFRRSEEIIYGFDDFGDEKDRIARESLELYAYSTEQVQLIAGDTQKLGTEELKATISSPIRFLHVDGGHTYSECMHDLMTFAPLLGKGAVIVVDDYYDREYPGVGSAVNAYCRSNQGRAFRPFLVGQNKLYLCQNSMVAQYQRGFVESAAFNRQLGAETMQDGVVLIPFSRYPLPKEKLRQMIE
jgi:hypothetical protein